MGQVNATASKTVQGTVDQVRAALADYRSIRPRILSSRYSEYEVVAGGVGAGTAVHWKLQATEKRVRDQLVDVSEDGDTLVEADRNSSMVTRWSVAPAGEGSSTVSVHTSWTGAGGIGGFFERTFAPGGLRKIYDEVLGNLDSVLAEK